LAKKVYNKKNQKFYFIPILREIVLVNLTILEVGMKFAIAKIESFA